MTPDEQKEFTALLCNTFRDQIVRAIDAGKIPATWSAIELRWLVEGMVSLSGLGGPDKKSDRYKAFAQVCRERFLV